MRNLGCVYLVKKGITMNEKNGVEPNDTVENDLQLKKVALTNAEKQKRFRDKKKNEGKKEHRGYLTSEAQTCYKMIAEQTQWSDSVILSNAIRLTYAAYKNGQIGLLNNWLNKHKL